MALPVGRPATYDDLLALPEHLTGQLIDGELYVSPRPATPHARALGELSHDLSGPFDAGRNGPGGWWFLLEPELHLQRDVLVPDLAGWRRERLPRLPRAAYLEIAPDWICEVLSPSNARVDRGRKLPKYVEAGVQHAWLVDPVARTLEILRGEGPRWILVDTVGGDERVRAAPFDAIELDLSRLWLPDDDAPGPL